MSPATSVMSVLALAAALAPAAAMKFYAMQSGDATYYGETQGGNCVLREPTPGMYSGMTPVAMNKAQYDKSASCGACLRVWGNGEGLGANPVTGEFYAYVSDQCPDCKWGDIDLARSGDGRWKVNWEFIECPNGDGKISFKFEGSNSHYYKVQPRGMKTPPVRVRIGSGEATRSQDNFWISHSGPFPQTTQIQVWCADGTYYNEWVSGHSGAVYGGTPASGGSSAAPAPKAAGQLQASSSSGGSGGATCTGDYDKCAGAPGEAYHQYLPCCTEGWECVQHSDIGGGKQCRPTRRR